MKMAVRPSSRFSYALRALVDLALHQASGPVTVAAVARRQGIPVRTLEQLLNRLRRAGLVDAERGPRGGYQLRQLPKQIPIRRVFELFEPAAKLHKKADGRGHDPAQQIWQQVQKAVQTALEAATLETLTAQAAEEAAAPMSHRFTFHI